ncbi:MAG: Hsp70 family protein [Chlamydiales bacterium]|nr:Hsp70 family protein [Chlamydiales bacterium]
MKTTNYIIGIDLGTTNCTMAYTSLGRGKHPEIIQFPIMQMSAFGVQEEHFSLPSFLYFPLEEEKEKHLFLDKKVSVGILARERGSEIPGRVISSAKSWLCHDGVQRRDPLLPLDAEDNAIKISPVEAITELLKHLQEVWNVKFPDDPFKEQTILITVPASFDPAARQLVEESAKLADYPEVILLEEPQAAFYAWLCREKEEWRSKLAVGDTVLVVDIGGGTSDFSLIRAEDDKGDLILKRLAVGTHLLLGGDNMDLSLAYLAKQKLEASNKSIDSSQMSELVHRCRFAKEELLKQGALEKVIVAVQGRGSKLIGGSCKVELSREEILKYIVDGFMPLVEPTERSPVEKKLGIRQIGLPYAQDARISCQLAKFLSMTGEKESASMDEFILPTAILFNGGALKANALQERLIELLNSWAKNLKKSPIKILDGVNLDYAVSVGSVYYGLSREGTGIRIRAGISRSYFIGIESAGLAIPGIQPKVKALCVASFGMEEGDSVDITGQEFTLLLGELASFRFFSHSTEKFSNGLAPTPGVLLAECLDELRELHPIETLLDKQGIEGSLVRVTLSSKVTELGSFQLWCRAQDGRKWKLEFDIR